MESSAVTEIRSEGAVGWRHPGWAERFPWLVQGATGRTAPDGSEWDLGLFAAASPSAAVQERWRLLRRDTGMPRAVHALQRHEAAVRWYGDAPPGLHVAEPCDGHATDRPGLLLTVSVADCVPVFVVDPERRAAALLHPGWRGAAAGILERGLAVLGERLGTTPDRVWLHLGPSICGACYEVGPEVFRALGLEEPPAPTPLDLRGALARRAREAGVPGERISTSTHCTLCGEAAFFSHRGGDAGRQVGYLGIRRPGGGS